MTEDVTINRDQLLKLWGDVVARIQAGEWDPERWPKDMRELHRKFCAGIYLLNAKNAGALDVTPAGDPEVGDRDATASALVPNRYKE